MEPCQLLRGWMWLVALLSESRSVTGWGGVVPMADCVALRSWAAGGIAFALTFHCLLVRPGPASLGSQQSMGAGPSAAISLISSGLRRDAAATSGDEDRRRRLLRLSLRGGLLSPGRIDGWTSSPPASIAPLFAAVCVVGARIRRRRCFAPPRRCAPRLQAAVDASLRSSTPVSELVSSSFAFLGAAAIVFLFAVYFRRLERLFRRRFVPALSPWSAVFLGVPVACVRLRLPLFHDVCLRILAAASPPPPLCVWDSGAIRPVFGEDLVSRRPFLYVCSEGAGG